jgi:hypothetical protein
MGLGQIGRELERLARIRLRLITAFITRRYGVGLTGPIRHQWAPQMTHVAP